MLVNLVLFKFIDIFVSKMILKYIFLYEKNYMIHIQYMNSQMRVLLRKYARGLRLYDLAVVFLNKNLRIRRGYPSLQLKE